MARRGQDLAQRFREVVASAEEARKRADAELARKRVAAREARDALLADLGAFGEAIGHLQVQAKSHEQGLTLRFRDRFLHFVPDGDADRVKVQFEGAEPDRHALLRDPDHGDRWVWRVEERTGPPSQTVLFDRGLEELVVVALGLPRPDAARPAVDPVTLEDVIPD